MSTFSGIEIGKRALQAQQKALNTTNHNVANANTPGYSRQRAKLSATRPHEMPALIRGLQAGQLGTGVQVSEVERIRDQFLDGQIRAEMELDGEWEMRGKYLEQVELVFNEPGETGIRQALDDYWAAWQELSKNPESLAARANIRERGQSLADIFNHTHSQLDVIQTDADRELVNSVHEVNSIASRIADLNGQIVRIEGGGQNANDLRDRRDLLLDELAEFVDIRVTESQTEGASRLTVSVGGQTLVQGTGFQELVTEPVTAGNADKDLSRIRWAETGEEARIEGGRMHGLLEMRGRLAEGEEGHEVGGGIQSYIDELDALAGGLIEEVNAIHRSGYGLEDVEHNGEEINGGDPVTDNPFFGGDDARTITVDEDLLGDGGLGRIAAASAPDTLPGDGSNAERLAALKEEAVDAIGDEGDITFRDYFSATISRLGVEAQRANRMQENQSLMVERLENRRESISGVSLDEEMTNMIRFQHAYAAAARNIRAVDEMLQVLVNMV